LNKPIIKDDHINIGHLFYFIINVIKKYLRTFLYIVFIYIAYFFLLKTPVYFSSASFYTNYNDASNLSSFGLLNSLTQGDSDATDLGFSIETYLSSENFLNDIIQRNYIIDNQDISLLDYWGKNYNKTLALNPIQTLENINRNINFRNNLSGEEKKLFIVKNILKKSLYHFEDDESSLHIVGITINNLELANQITNAIVSSVIDYSTYITNIKAREKAEFIEGRLIEVRKSLENSENKKLLFLENNTNPESPSLILTIERMNREILLHSQVYVTLSEQLEMAKIDNKDNTSSIFLLDKSYVSSYKPGKSFFENLLFLFTLFFGVLIVFEGYKKRNFLIQ
tara:strand:+ start:2932 stop:3948 length:1017 start_codon:yes stop_codon:yes gene_type:complete